jgi:hypothetical protein
MARSIPAVFFFLVTLARAAAVEPLVGTWTLSSQSIDGQKVDSDPLTLRIYPSGTALEFAYSVPINGVHLVSLKFTAIYLDGKEGQIKNVRGETVGTAKVTKTGPMEYKTVIKGPNRPTVSGKITISADNKTLQSESDSQGNGPTHTVQVFSRR